MRATNLVIISIVSVLFTIFLNVTTASNQGIFTNLNETQRDELHAILFNSNLTRGQVKSQVAEWVEQQDETVQEAYQKYQTEKAEWKKLFLEVHTERIQKLSSEAKDLDAKILKVWADDNLTVREACVKINDLIGGVIWTAACLSILPIIRTIGLGIAVLLYSFANCLTQWIIGNYGFFSLTMKRPPPIEKLWINYCGLLFLLIGGFMITFVKNKKKQPKVSTVSTVSTIPMFPQLNSNKVSSHDYTTAMKRAYYRVSVCQLRKLNYQRLVAVIAAIFSGVLYGIDIVPILIMQESGYFPGTPTDNKVFVLSYYVGIGLTTSVVFIIYCVLKKNRPFVNPQLTVPSLISGVIWAVAQALFIISTGTLSIAVSGPISAIVPGCVASVWSVFYFKEISGKRNLLMLAISIIVTTMGVIFISVSKQ
ncbi:hypothetical protein M3Y95_00119600 [Aphelenchoides besseyi]|nr:hypothetical protein M3Y95_00119600 [Aphelenchoides besseyi]